MAKPARQKDFASAGPVHETQHFLYLVFISLLTAVVMTLFLSPPPAR